MKLHTTRKQIREANMPIIAVGYCDMQTVFEVLGIEPFAYSTRAEGWACDYYEIEGKAIISTGYAPIGKPIDGKGERALEERAREIRSKASWWLDKRAISGLRKRLMNWLWPAYEAYWKARIK